MSKRFSLTTTLGAILATGLVVGCSDSADPDDSGPPPATATVTATAGIAFSPSSARVATGGTVTWVFQNVPHNVTFDAAAGVPADIPGTNSNVSIDRTFTTTGSFSYVCTIHPGMSGAIQVEAP